MKLWNSLLLAPAVLLCLGLAGCQDECESCEYGVPAAPYALRAELFRSGIHVTWKDASDNEEFFIVERAARSSARSRPESSAGSLATPSQPQAFGHHFLELVRLPRNSEDYLDTEVYVGMTYSYRIKAVNAAGSSTSEELEVAFP
ncbi:hypothetical protein [Nannocystis pusilla]|uniref:hypothetical protein n=1 Tax=Nannocystis pusilla TaxID=889268 RepID=UPI003BF1702F